MGREIERRYLINKLKWDELSKPIGLLYRQGYLCIDKDKTIRVRVANDIGYITIKGISVGLVTPEFEYQIPLNDANELLNNHCISELIKTRYLIGYNTNVWEVDVFLGDNEDLIIAEIELESADQTYDLPNWVGKEIIGDKKYFNLTTNPYKNWKYD